MEFEVSDLKEALEQSVRSLENGYVFADRVSYSARTIMGIIEEMDPNNKDDFYILRSSIRTLAKKLSIYTNEKRELLSGEFCKVKDLLYPNGGY